MNGRPPIRLMRYPDAVVIDQKPIGTSVRSTPAIYTGIMDEIRKIFGKANSVAPSLFSFNSKGACPVCKGMWKIVFDMAFADAVEVVCEECGGHRYNSAKDVPHLQKCGTSFAELYVNI